MDGRTSGGVTLARAEPSRLCRSAGAHARRPRTGRSESSWQVERDGHARPASGWQDGGVFPGAARDKNSKAVRVMHDRHAVVVVLGDPPRSGTGVDSVAAGSARRQITPAQTGPLIEEQLHVF